MASLSSSRPPRLFLILSLYSVFLHVESAASSLKQQERNESDITPETRQQRACQYSHTFSNVGEWVNLNSENYPNTYPNNLDCRYTLTSPRGTQMTLECPTFNVEPSPGTNCDYDVFFWSLNGDPLFRDRQFACGNGYLSQKKSVGTRLTIGFRSDDTNPSTSPPFRYQCRVEVVPTPCSCGVSGADTRIVGGIEAKPAQYPWRVALFSQNTGIFCGATLISQSWLLTAAHCTREFLSSGDIIYADIGDHNVTSTGDADNRVIRIDRIIQNSQYNPVNQNHDTSLLHLSQPVAYARNIQPACLPWKYTSQTFNGVTATASGWGTTSFGGSQSEVLRKVDLDVIGTQNCRQKYAGRVEITDNMMCAARAGKDTCQSDSGGSLDYRDPGTGSFYAIGVVSFGIGCAEPDNPGVYAQVINYLGWIEQNSDETFCKA